MPSTGTWPCISWEKKHATQPVAVMSEEVLQLATRTYLVLLVQASQIIIALFRALFA